MLDTWFSSGLWPFSTLGWPDITEDLRVYYPTSLLITGFDIIFFWGGPHDRAGPGMHGRVPLPRRPTFTVSSAMPRAAEDAEDKGQRDRSARGDAEVRHRRSAVGAAGMELRRATISCSRMSAWRRCGILANKIWNAARFLFMNMETSGVEPWTPILKTTIPAGGRRADAGSSA